MTIYNTSEELQVIGSDELSNTEEKVAKRKKENKHIGEIIEYLDKYLIRRFIDHTQSDYYVVSDPVKRELKMLTSDKELGTRVLVAFLQHNPDFANERKYAFYKAFAIYDKMPLNPIATRPPLFHWSIQKDAWSLKQLDNGNFCKGEYPTIKSFMDRVSDPTALKCMIWATFEPKYMGRRVPHLHGAGNDGRSTFTAALREFIGHQASMSMSDSRIKGDQRFLTSQMIGKRLITHNDSDISAPLNMPFIKSLTGRDMESAEIKGVKEFVHFRYEAVYMFTSNRALKIDNTTFSKTRALPLKVEPLPAATIDSLASQKMVAEMPHFIFDCMLEYKRHVTNHVDIPLSPITLEHIDSAIKDGADDLDLVLEEHFIVSGDKKDWIKTQHFDRFLLILDTKYQHLANRHQTFSARFKAHLSDKVSRVARNQVQRVNNQVFKALKGITVSPDSVYYDQFKKILATDFPNGITDKPSNPFDEEQPF